MLPASIPTTQATLCLCTGQISCSRTRITHGTTCKVVSRVCQSILPRIQACRLPWRPPLSSTPWTTRPTPPQPDRRRPPRTLINPRHQLLIIVCLPRDWTSIFHRTARDSDSALHLSVQGKSPLLAKVSGTTSSWIPLGRKPPALTPKRQPRPSGSKVDVQQSRLYELRPHFHFCSNRRLRSASHIGCNRCDPLWTPPHHIFGLALHRGGHCDKPSDAFLHEAFF